MKKEARRYFFGKKVTKKLLLNGGCGKAGAIAARQAEFFCFVLFTSLEQRA
jgi:hypothetical protein